MSDKRRLWESLEHNGVALPPPYQVRNLSVRTGSGVIHPNSLAEEMLYAIAKKKDTPYVRDEVFTSNFMKSLSEADSQFKGLKFSDLDLSEFFSTINAEKNSMENMTKEQRKQLRLNRRELKEKLRAEYGTMLLDGKKVGIRNFVIEPPSLFMGRGQHPLRGTWKSRVKQSDITLNLGEDAKVPPGDWKVVHDHSGIWVARWPDPITGKLKYVWVAAGDSKVDASRKKAKFDKANAIAERITKIRSAILQAMSAKSIEERQLGTACFLIDRLGFRVGNEKGAGEADTVGCTTLRVEHVSIDGDKVSYDFLGKDSVPWHKEIVGEPLLISNLTKFIRGKKPSDFVFDKISSGDVNNFFKKVAKVTAKAFRTYHASRIVREYLASKDVSKSPESEKFLHAKLANLEAAKFCNHKKNVSANYDEQVQKKLARIEHLRAKGRKTDKLEVGLRLLQETREYNLGTSLNSYIDPRVFKEWSSKVGFDWTKLYTKSQLKELKWVH